MLLNQESETMSMGKITERCRPDYEAQIKNQREKLSKAENLKSALLDYLNHRRISGPLAEMLGELVSETVSLEKTIADLIQRQEADPEK
jgi:hypothetical protein